MNSLTAFFIGLFFSWLGMELSGLLGWFSMLVTALLVVMLDSVSRLKDEEGVRE